MPLFLPAALIIPPPVPPPPRKVRKDAARPRKLRARSVVREAAYARYANIYKDHAAETYAKSIEASLREKGGVEAFRRRVVSASLDAERYWGYDEACVSTDGRERKAGSALGDGVPFSSSSYSGPSGGIASVATNASSSTFTAERGEGRGDGSLHLPRDGASSQGSVLTTGELEESSFTLSEAEGPVGEGGERGGVTTATEGRNGGEIFVDVVQFNNVRAKYLRSWDDTALSRPFHVPPLPSWRPEGGASLRSVVSRGGPSPPTTAASGGTSEACFGTGDHATQRRNSAALNLNNAKAWGRA